jgi:hypothetical protein
MTPQDFAQMERRWRHLANWLWLAPLVWGLSGGLGLFWLDQTWMARLILVPLWLILAGALAYLAVTTAYRWPRLVRGALVTGGLAGLAIACWIGPYAAITSSLVVPLTVLYGAARVPPDVRGPAALTTGILLALGPVAFLIWLATGWLLSPWSGFVAPPDHLPAIVALFATATGVLAATVVIRWRALRRLR